MNATAIPVKITEPVEIWLTAIIVPVSKDTMERIAQKVSLPRQ